jgi:hypothetical protein
LSSWRNKNNYIAKYTKIKPKARTLIRNADKLSQTPSRSFNFGCYHLSRRFRRFWLACKIIRKHLCTINAHWLMYTYIPMKERTSSIIRAHRWIITDWKQLTKVINGDEKEAKETKNPSPSCYAYLCLNLPWDNCHVTDYPYGECNAAFLPSDICSD